MSGIPKPSYRRTHGIACLLLAGLFLGGCASPDPVYLPALTADPMASYSHSDLEVEYRVEEPKHTSWFMGSQVEAGVSISWTPNDGANVDVIIEDILNKSEAAGWAFETLQPEPVDTGETYWWAQKYLDEGLASLVVKWDPSSSRRGAELWMHLDYVEEDVATPVLTVERNADYESVADLRDAVAASGIRCTDFQSQSEDGVSREPAPAARCNESVWLNVFEVREDARAYVEKQFDSGTARGQSYLLGPNWVVSFAEDVDFGSYLRDELGGELVASGVGS